jgi:hypothetical protein
VTASSSSFVKKKVLLQKCICRSSGVRNSATLKNNACYSPLLVRKGNIQGHAGPVSGGGGGLKLEGCLFLSLNSFNKFLKKINEPRQLPTLPNGQSGPAPNIYLTIVIFSSQLKYRFTFNN